MIAITMNNNTNGTNYNRDSAFDDNINTINKIAMHEIHKH